MPKQAEQQTTQRLDKWLWVARFFKSRTMATEAVTGGKVQCNGERSKPGKSIKPGDCLTIRKGVFEFEIVVEQLSRQRLSSPAAQNLYTETEGSVEQRESRREQLKSDRLSMPVSERKPNKRDRRILLAAKNQK